MAGKYALLIGTSRFGDARFPALEKPAKDVGALETVLRSATIGAFDDVRTLLDPPCEKVRREVARLFAGRKPDDLVLLFFAGHGVKDDYGKLYLVAADTDRDLLTATALGADFVTQEMDQSRSRKQVLLLDCCHSGALAEGVRAADASAGSLEAFTGRGTGKVIITASDSYEFAWEGGETPAAFENSLFTHFLVDGLRTGKADMNGDGLVTLDELYKYVHQRVLETTPKQTPQWKLADAAGDIEIARNPAPSAPLPEDLTSAVKSAMPYVREGVVHELKRVLRGSNPALAESARNALEKLATDADRRVRSAARKVLDAAKDGRIDTEGTGDFDSSRRLPVPAPPPPPPPKPEPFRPAPPRPSLSPPEPRKPEARKPEPRPPEPAPPVKKRRTGLLIAALIGIPFLALVLAVSVYSVLQEQQRERYSAPPPALSAPPAEAFFDFAPWLPGTGSASFQLSIDGRGAGVLSNAGAGGRVSLGPLAPGLHTFRLENLTLYNAGGVPVSANGWCQNQFFALPGKTSYSVVLSINFSGGVPRPDCGIQ
jgi:hypothetical protein